MFRTICLAGITAVFATASVAGGEGKKARVNAGIGNGGELVDDGATVTIDNRAVETFDTDLDPGRSGDHNAINTWDNDRKPLTVGRFKAD